MDNTLSMIGLALRAGRLEVGDAVSYTHLTLPTKA